MKNKNGDVVIRSFECYDWFEIENFFATEIGTTSENFCDLGIIVRILVILNRSGMYGMNLLVMISQPICA
jgi:hypothetical protein